MLIIRSRAIETKPADEWPWVLLETDLEGTSGYRIQGGPHLEELSGTADWIEQRRSTLHDHHFPYVHSHFRNWRALTL